MKRILALTLTVLLLTTIVVANKTTKVERHVGNGLVIGGIAYMFISNPNPVGFTAVVTGMSLVNSDTNHLYISTGFDPQQALIGGTVNGRGYDGELRVYYSNKIEVGYFYERFSLIDVRFFGIFTGYSTTTKYGTFSSQLEGFRTFQKWGNYYSYGFNIEYRTPTYKRFNGYIKGNLRKRNDLSTNDFRYSNMIGITFKL